MVTVTTKGREGEKMIRREREIECTRKERMGHEERRESYITSIKGTVLCRLIHSFIQQQHLCIRICRTMRVSDSTLAVSVASPRPLDRPPSRCP